jgi:hypothetical protein
MDLRKSFSLVLKIAFLYMVLKRLATDILSFLFSFVRS